MKKRRSLLWLPLIAFLTASCWHDLEIPSYTDETPALCVKCSLKDTDTLHVLSLSISTGDKLSAPVGESSFRLWKGDQIVADQIDSMWYSDGGKVQTLSFVYYMDSGEASYKLDVHSGSLQASSRVLSAPPYAGHAIITDSLSVKDKMQFRQFESMKIKVPDIPGERNYYCLYDDVFGRIVYWKGDKEVASFKTTCGRMALSPFIPGIGTALGLENQGTHWGYSLFSDYSFQDEAFYVQVSFQERNLITSSWGMYDHTSAYDRITVSVVLLMGTLTAEEYEYLTLLHTPTSSLANEPVMLPNNIQGGFGHFAVQTLTEIEVPLEGTPTPPTVPRPG